MMNLNAFKFYLKQFRQKRFYLLEYATTCPGQVAYKSTFKKVIHSVYVTLQHQTANIVNKINKTCILNCIELL